ncbi:MAG: hypothetical protein PHO53_06060 [Actinomycetota bacterium]|nr:hypothetical protein [Actinomycetota bacterium]
MTKADKEAPEVLDTAGELSPSTDFSSEAEEISRRSPRERRGKVKGSAPVGVVFFVLIAIAAAIIVFSGIYAWGSKIDYGKFFFLLVVFILADHFDLKLKDGATMSLGVAPLVGAIFCLPWAQAIWVFILGALVTLITRKFGEVKWDDVLVRLISLIGVAAMAGVFYALKEALPAKPLWSGGYSPYQLLSLIIAAAVYFLMYVTKEIYLLSDKGQIPIRAYFKSVVMNSWVPYLELCFLGALFGLIFTCIGIWHSLIVLPMLFVLMYAYNMVTQADEYLMETVRVLSAIPERVGLVDEGHAGRVAELSGKVARELGLSPDEVKQIVHAAYLHDMGAIRKQAVEASQPELLEAEGVVSGGVDIVGGVDYLEIAAEILRGREGLGDRVASLSRRKVVDTGVGIIRVVNDFDKLVRGSEGREPLSEAEALTEMNLERGVKYDSKVLRAIARVLARTR